MLSPHRLIFALLLPLLFFAAPAGNAQLRTQSGLTSSKTAYYTAIVKLPFHRYYREIGYEVDAEGRAIYQGDIDLGPASKLRTTSEVNRRQFRSGKLPNGLLKLRPSTKFPAIRQLQLRAPRPPAFTKSSINLDPALKWPGGVVPFEIANNFSDPDYDDLIQAAIDFLEANTNVSFVPRVNHADYIRFVSCPKCPGGGSSAVGRQGGRQKIRLKEGEIDVGGIVHEIMHALGVYHTQSRPDRDDYICVNLDNVPESAEHNFDIHDGEDYAGVYGAYDIHSVMHYHSCAFVDGDCTLSSFANASILPRNPNGSCDPTFIFGGSEFLANIPDSDLATINYLYGPVAGGLGGSVPTDQVRTLTVSLLQLTTLVGPEETGVGCNNDMDFYATVELGPLADINQDPYRFSRSDSFTYDKEEGNNIQPGWTANTTLQPGERFGLIRINVWDDDKAGPGGIGACGGPDDVVDVSPFSNMRRLDLVVDTKTNEVHLSRTTSSFPPGKPRLPSNLIQNSTLNGRLGYLFQGLPTAGNTTGENHAASIRVWVGLE